jgi:transglutaminase-like putative cysteine protease
MINSKINSFFYDRTKESITHHIALGNYSAFAVKKEKSYLWIASRSKKQFMRKFTLNGTLLEQYSIKKRPSDIIGLEKRGGTFYFLAGNKKQNHLYSWKLHDKAVTQVMKLPGQTKDLLFYKNHLLITSQHFDTYSNSWLYEVSLKEKKLLSQKQFFSINSRAIFSVNEQLFYIRQKKSDLIIAPFSYLDKNTLVSEPLYKKASYTHQIKSKNSEEYNLEAWIALPINRRFQTISNLTYTVQPDKIITDRYGNKWAHFSLKKLSGKKTNAITLHYDIKRVKAVFTLDRSLLTKDIKTIQKDHSQYLRNTYSFNFNNSDVRDLTASIKRKPHIIDDIISVRNRLNNHLNVVGPSGPESQASDFIKQGVGRCYAHTISFAAIMRKLGYPTRAIGGGYPSSKETKVHTWNQVYMPNLGWVDIDTLADDKKDNKHSYRYMGQHRQDYTITFIGEYDKRDFHDIFSQRSWLSNFKAREVNSNRRIKLTYKRLFEYKSVH